MTTIAVALNFDNTKKQDVEALLAKLNGKQWSAATKENYHEAVKKFWRWLRGLPSDEDPEETVGGAKGRKIIPEELLTTEEANAIIAAAEHPRDKAYAAVTDESGARPEEILSAKIRKSNSTTTVQSSLCISWLYWCRGKCHDRAAIYGSVYF